MNKKIFLIGIFLIAVSVSLTAISANPDVNVPDGFKVNDDLSVKNQKAQFLGMDAIQTIVVLENGTDNIIKAFSSVHPYMKYITLIIVPMFGITTAVSWAYYGSKQFSSLFGKKLVAIYYAILFIAYFLCGIAEDFNTILDVADFLNLSITIPNIIALIMMSKVIIKESKRT